MMLVCLLIGSHAAAFFIAWCAKAAFTEDRDAETFEHGRYEGYCQRSEELEPEDRP